MSITKEFLSLFSHFVANYKRNGTPAFYNWAKEQNHPEISGYIEQLQVIIIKNQETFHDTSIIEHLSNTVLLSARTNPYLLECWIDFLKKYNAKLQIYGPIGEILINVNGTGSPSEKMLHELQVALSTTIHASSLAQQAYQTDTELLRNEIVQLREVNRQLSVRMTQLQEQVDVFAEIKAFNPRIQTAQEELGHILKLLSTLNERTDKHYIAPSEVITPHSEINIIQNTSFSPPQTAPITQMAPPPPPPPNIMPSSPQFFNVGGLLSDINKAKNNLRSTHTTADNAEKKNFRVQ